MKAKDVEYLLKNNICFESAIMQNGDEAIFINEKDRKDVLNYFKKRKILEDYQFRQNYEKVLIIFK